MSTTQNKHRRGQHALRIRKATTLDEANTRIAALRRRVQQLETENHRLAANDHESLCAVARLQQWGNSLQQQLKTQAGKVVRAEAEQERLRQAVINARPRITQIEYPARVPMYATDGKGLPVAFCPYPDAAAFRSLDRPPVAAHDPEATQPIAQISLPDGETTLTLRTVA